MLLVIFYNFLNGSKFMRTEAEVPRKGNRIQPELCALIGSIYVDMRRLIGLMAEKIE